MRLKISTQPISTSRSPRNGSRPVVSVSRTISRMSTHRRGGESGSALRHLNNLGQNVPDSAAHGVKTVRGIPHEIGALAFFGVRQLSHHDGLESLSGHGAPGEDALALDFRRRRYHDHRIDALLATGFEQKRHIPHDNRRSALLGVL